MRLIPKWFALQLADALQCRGGLHLETDHRARWSLFWKPSRSGWRSKWRHSTRLAPYADYALNGQGKHLRPALVALTANALGKMNDSHVTVAVIIEMVHLATLVHDDVMDEAEIRRGQPTLAANWGNEIAVLVRRLPLCACAEAGGQLSHTRRSAGRWRRPPTRSARAKSCRPSTGATSSFTREEYFKVLEMKTAELFALSCDLAPD